MSETQPEEMIVGKEPTPEQNELIGWAEEAIKSSMGTVTNALWQLILLISALFGGGLALDKEMLNPVCRIVALVCLLVSLAVALWGALPYSVSLNPAILDDLRKAREDSFRCKDRSLRIASTGLLMAFLAAAAGLAIKLFC